MHYRTRALMILAGLLSFHIPVADAATCEGLAALKLPDTVITQATPINPPPDFVISSVPFGTATVSTPFCRVAGTVAPAIKFEVWLPQSGSWNGKLQGVGTGGVSGAINFKSMGDVLRHGYAAVSSDLGHEGDSIDFKFAVGHPELVADWGYRGTHEMTDKAKQIVAVFYGRSAQHAYFTGCSGGGRQALMEAQRYPDDYDGIVAGDPTSDFTHLTLGGRLWEAITTLKDPASYIPASKITTIARAVVAACDAQDGIVDGIIDDPQKCKFDPASLQCKAGDAADCLTSGQVKALKTIYAGATNSKGKRIFPGYMPGGELGPSGWAAYISGDAPMKSGQLTYADGFVKYMVFENPDANSLAFNYDKDMPLAEAKLSAAIDATDPNLDQFRKRGGKLIQYHGWSDPGVSPLSSVDYYERVVDRLNSGAFTPGALAQTQKFYRLFMVPGMQHCSGGPGPDQFDALAALEKWVEADQPPKEIVASHVSNGTVDRSRILCPYPSHAKWTGSGSTDDAKNFVCSGNEGTMARP